MDHDDNDFQGQNLQLAGEGSSNFSPVLRPYALPKFDFDDSLQGHLRFDSLVENEVFLGIPSQEDNQWIEDFSRGNSGIEFSSSAAESCSISRRNNVWSEATSSESVEMLLKSVGQGEMIPGETIIEEPDAGDELGSLTNQMEPDLKQDDKIEDVIDSQPALPPDEFRESFSGLNEGAEGERLHANCTSQTQEAELSSSTHGSSRDMDPSAVSEKCGIVSEENLVIDKTCDDSNLREVDTSVNESLNKKVQEDPSASGILIGNIDFSSQNITASLGRLDDKDVSNVSFENPHDLPKDYKGVEEHSIQNQEANMDDQILIGNAVETSIITFDEISSLPLKGDCDAQIAEGSNKDVFSTDSSLGSKSEVMVFTEGTDIAEQFEGNPHEESPVVFQSDASFEDHDVEVGSTKGQSSSIPENENFHESDSQMDKGASVSSSVECILSGDNKPYKEGDESSISDLARIAECSSAELVREEPAVDNIEGGDTAPGVQKDSNAEVHVSPPMVAGSMQICEDNVFSEQGDVHKGSQVVSLPEKGNSKLPTGSSEMESEAVASLDSDKRVEALPSGGSMEQNVIKAHGAEFGTITENKSVDVAEENTNLESCVIVDGFASQSGSGAATSDEVMDHREEHKSPAPGIGFTYHDKQEKMEVGAPISTSLSTLKEPSQVASHLGSVSQVEKGSCGDCAAQNVHETIDQLVPSVETCNASNESEQSVVANEVGQECSEKMEVSPTPCDLTDRGGDNADAVAFGNTDEIMVERNLEVASLEVADALPIPNESEVVTEPASVSLVRTCPDMVGDHEANQTVESDSGLVAANSKVDPVCSSEGDAIHTLEGGGNSADSDKANCGSPTVISCIEISHSDRDKHEGVKGATVESSPLSYATDGVDGKLQSSSKENDASKEERSFTFEVSPLVVSSEGETGKGWQSFPTVQACKITTIDGSPSTSGGGQIDFTIAQEMPRSIPQANDGGTTRGGSKGTPERKPRRGSGKSAGKDNAKKGNHMKEKPPAKESDRGDKSSVPTSPLGTSQFVQPEELKLYGNVERSGAKASGVISVPTSNLPDLNTSLPPSALFQQPFTDVQQVQLRAQIFVYGSLIQGAAPDEACMVSAFGPSDGGRSVWEPKWRAYLERLHGQKSTPNNSESPAQPRSGTRTPDQAIKHGSHQTKVLSSPVGRASSKGTPSSVVNPMIPLSSPLWNVSTPTCDGLQSGAMPRNPLLDYHQAHSPLNPYQAPAVRNFVGHSPSWLSQASFPGPWIASPQTASFDASARFSRFPITEAVKLTPVKESSAPVSSSTKHVSPIPVAYSVGSSVFAGTSSLLDVQKVTVSPGQHSAEPKSRKRKKVPVTEDLGQISLPAQTQTESVSASVVSGHFSKKIAVTEDLGHISLLPLTKTELVSTPVVNSHFSTTVAVTSPASFASKSNSGKLLAAVSPTSSTDHPKRGDQNAEKKIAIAGETFSEVEEAKLYAEDAATHAAAAVSRCQGVWSQLDKQKNSGLVSDIEAKLSSAAVTIAAAASVAKAAAAAAKIASNAAIQAKLMVEEALVSSGTGNPTQSTTISLPNTTNNLGKATPATILKGGDGSKSSSSIILAAREAARRRVEAASAASKHAENLDAIVKAAELAAEAVSQAGKIVAMGDPLPLSELLDFGPDGYWRSPQVPSEQGAKLNNDDRDQIKTNNVEKVPSVSAKQPNEGPSDKEMPTTSHGTVTSGEMDSRGQRGRRVSELAKTIGVIPESEFGSISTSDIGQDEYDREMESSNENSIKQGCLVEVLKDGANCKAGWFSARVLRLKDEKAFVGYTQLKSDKGQLQEWVSVEDKGNKAPRIRVAHPMTTMHSEGTRKRRRAALTDYAWSVGERVDAWMEDCWCEGVVIEKNQKDETTLTVRFPAQGEKSVKAWDLRPTLVWKDGEWIEWSSSRGDRASQGDTPKEKRLKLASHVMEDKGKDKVSKSNLVEPEKHEDSRLLPISVNEKTFNIGKSTRENKLDALGPMRTTFQKEGSGVNIGVPKPGKKRKFMAVSKHYISESSNKSNLANDSVKFARYLMPQGSRGSKNSSSKIYTKDKQAAESKPKGLRSGKPPIVSGRTLPQKDNLLTTSNATITGRTVKSSISNEEKESGQQKSLEFESSSNAEVGQMVFSSKPLPPDAPKRFPSAKAKSERMNKGKFVSAGGKSTRVEVKDRSVPDVVEPRRSNRRIQPTSRLLEGLQSSLIISKIPAASHDKSHRSQNRGTSKGN